ncbi:MAG: hypothetical protein MSG64_07435 [Pyrinomonadaceae bacterium MAG19_C2-C3]|nr:hypothetical protein [Pyrinomonadaceae bacterium MAG19_C2-C3]
MGRRHVIEKLDESQLDFVINAIIAGMTDREISMQFEETFSAPLAKSSLNRWRTAAGNELAERHQLARYQAKQFLENVGEIDADKYQTLLGSIEDRLLTATRDVIMKDPLKLLKIRQEEENRRLKVLELELKREHLALDRERLRGAAIDRVALSGELLKDLLELIGSDADGLKFIKRFAKPFDEFVKAKYAATA